MALPVASTHTKHSEETFFDFVKISCFGFLLFRYFILAGNMPFHQTRALKSPEFKEIITFNCNTVYLCDYID